MRARIVLTGSTKHSDHPGLLPDQIFGSGQNRLLHIAFYILLSHLMANWSQRRKFDYSVSALETSK